MPEKTCPLFCAALIIRTHTPSDMGSSVEDLKTIILCLEDKCEFWSNKIERCVIHSFSK
jgi:hypothetical protein